MLKSLTIENIALIEHLEIDFSKNFNVLTGETGAGKSIILNSISAVLGDKITSDVIRSGAESAFFEAVFDIGTFKDSIKSLIDIDIDLSENIIIIQREISRDGKNKCKINNKTVLMNQIKDISQFFIDIHSQHDHQSLLNIDNHLILLDKFTGIVNEVNNFGILFDEINKLTQELNNIKEKEKEKERLLELAKFAANEIDSMKLKENEEEELEKELKFINSIQKIIDLSNDIYSEIYSNDKSALNTIQKIIKSFESLISLDNKLSFLMDDINDVLFKLENIKENIKNYKNNLDFSPQLAEEISERLFKIRELKRKYNSGDIKSLLNYSNERKKEIEDINKILEIKEKLEKEIAEKQKIAEKKCIEISQKRREGAKKLSELIEKELSELAMTKAKFGVDFKYISDKDSFVSINNKGVKVNKNGIDRVEFLISTNIGEELKSLKKVASGGELSRIMLAIKSVLASLDNVETLIFDEIDAGIGGETAFSVGKKLKLLSKNKQIICITHLAQIAVMADCNFKVYKYEEKNRTKTNIIKLDKKEKINEIARMIGGDVITESSINYAKELIEKVNEKNNQNELF